MAVYDNRQMNRMRQDAIRRSQEMYKRSMTDSQRHSQGNQRKNDIASQPAEETLIEETDKAENKIQPNRHISGKRENQITEIFSKFTEGKIDSDKLIIIALMVLLAKEGADMKLILALGYILL